MQVTFRKYSIQEQQNTYSSQSIIPFYKDEKQQNYSVLLKVRLVVTLGSSTGTELGEI